MNTREELRVMLQQLNEDELNVTLAAVRELLTTGDTSAAETVFREYLADLREKKRTTQRNGFEGAAKVYRMILNREGLDAEEREHLERKIRVYEFLGTVDDATRHELFDSTAFNDILKGYLQMSLDRLPDLDDETKQLVSTEVRFSLDTASAAEAEAYFTRGF